MAESTDFEILEHLVYSVFLPPKLPQEEQEQSLQTSVDLEIIRSVIQAGRQYSSEAATKSQWSRVELMLEKLYKYVETPIRKERLYEDMQNMETEVLHIRAQNTGLIIRKHCTYTIFEAFEVQARTSDVMSVPGKIVRQFPGPAVQISNTIFCDSDFSEEVANIITRMDTEIFDEARPKSRKGGNEVDESRDSINPNYFIQFFFGLLRGMGTTVDPPRVVKRLGDEVLWKNALNPWRRSPIWLVVRIALQTSLDSATTYKHFIAYYHAEILSRCYKCELFSSDLLYAMRVKMARRLYKLKGTAPHFLLETAKVAVDGVQKLLQRRWDSIQSVQAKSPNRDFSDIDFESAINHTLPHSRSYLKKVFQGRTSSDNPSQFTPNDTFRLQNITRFSEYADGGLSRAFSSDPHLALFDFEASVFQNLSTWTTIATQQDKTKFCKVMSSCFRQYLNAAQTYYTADAADKSIMVLTLVRIWMAIDTLATDDCPLLKKFSPALPEDILDPLLIRTTQHIEQARVVQQYIRRRRVNASTDNPSIFSDKATERCFAVQYYQESPSHQQLKAKIETYAQEQKEKKCQELVEKNEKYDQLSRAIRGMSHKYSYTNGRANHHKWSCELCSKERERDNLQIKPYEWPLPTDRLSAEAVIFELKRPESFAIWRDLTYEILVDLGSLSPRDKCDHYDTLEGYNALNSWLSSASTPRITIASAPKSLMQSHYSSTITIPTSESKVCANNALQFQLYDRNGEAWATGPFKGVSFAKFGTFKLPSGSLYRHLEYALEQTTHTSNQVLADQHICPMELGLHEHIAFGTLRSGARLQWMNIVRGLEEDLLTFRSDEVWLLHTQAAWQVGPLSDDGSREWHEELGYAEFRGLLVSQCERVLGRVKANWLQAKSVLILVALVTRLLATSPPVGVTHAACEFLRKARDVAYQWLKELLNKLRDARYESDVIGYQRLVCEMASICRATYDVEPDYLDRLLSLSEDFIPLVEASIRLYDNQPPNLQNSPTGLQIVLCRDRRFAHKLMPYMLMRFRRGDDILSKPLSMIWSGYLSGSPSWQILDSPKDCWVKTVINKVNEADKGEAQHIHLNLLSGRLLIDGTPIGRLPRQYVEHATYVRLFGQKALDVAPTKIRGMKFAMADRIGGYQVLFALEEGQNELIIQAEKDDRVYELVPHKKLSDDFPVFLSEDYHHWADIKSRTIEFRPISDPWTANNCRWTLRFADFIATTVESASDKSFLVDVHSAAFKTLTRSLSPLESDRYLHVTRSTKGHIEVELPRMKLSFFINNDMQLESRNFRGLVLDENQSAGTLIGLRSQLILRAKGPVTRTLPQSRSILIPVGEINYTMSGHHTLVFIQFDSRRAVDVYRYKIDEDLGYLATDSGLTSRLLKTYLHALTSSCLPDPLTGRTGTEEALYELSQASTLSFEQIDVKQAGVAFGKPLAKELELIPRLFMLGDNYEPTRVRVESFAKAAEFSIEDHPAVLVDVTDIEGIIFTAGVWPRITPRIVLQQLSLQNRGHTDSLPRWKNELIGYAQVFVDYQRSQRLINLAHSKNIEEFYKELDLSSGEFDPGLDNPDWLLVQIDGNFGARALQRRVGQEMISPSSGSNTVLQLNMGEGKSSVIVPIVACSLADSSQLMFDLLVNRLSGLANRRIYYLPFGRHVPIDAISAQKLRDLYEEYRLISIKGSSEIADKNALREIQGWLETHTRDILDESDEILHVRYQLVYTIGKQQPPEDHPDRWTTTQQLLGLCATHIEKLQREYPDSLTHRFTGDAQFPTLRIMPDCPIEVERKLTCALATDVRDGRVLNLNCDRLPFDVRSSLIKLLTNKKLPFSEYKRLREACDSTTWKGLLLVRGLLASGILVFALKHKLYRVDYGLDLSRSLLAVPYRAKDIPSLKAEFGHPDIAIVLTCLSYYYHGLTDDHLDRCFKLLFKLDNPSEEYEQWVKRNKATPEEVKQLNGVNLLDREQFAKRLIPTFARNSATINFFLSSVVFPKGAKEFPSKLSTSGWDLAETKHHFTTGFSGTNDNRYLLPTSIAQTDPVKQLSTNALVLDYILQAENNHYVCMRGNNERFLELLVAQDPEIRVLLDVGALMLELQNEELVRYWLRLRPDVEAAVYFNDCDELVVLPRNGTPALFSTSSFTQQLDKCIVYLDDGHTRGTDLKFPRETRALVTLGPKVTKDRLLQGCMRMRKLGHGQSVIFAAPPEIDAQIRNASPSPIKPDARIDALDILRWAMLETCKDLKHHVPHWTQQGVEYFRRNLSEKEYEKIDDIATLAEGWTKPESRSLEEMLSKSQTYDVD
ncbi:unnamed protein product [Rhizoctonia solani]|uniref:ubiquitinyl hydrolase 1 n=1 Tax=Rhizoctonia solani TaxID=456999 RepID=A0A8H3D444_9AGAM|nr:unnamed protein product [Rhizoctonia solani]